jgi:hypothetical protein
VGLRAGLDIEAREKVFLPLLGIESLSPCCPVRSQTILTEVPWLLMQQSTVINITLTDDSRSEKLPFYFYEIQRFTAVYTRARH